MTNQSNPPVTEHVASATGAASGGGCGALLAFGAWITAFEEEVVEGEYGYEPGEFTVFPEHWRPMWREGLTPSQAFKRACDAATDARREDDEGRRRNWERIQAEDRAAIAKATGASQ